MSTRVLAATVWTALLLSLCLMPAHWLHGEDTGVGIPHVDKLVHASLFAGFAWLWLRAGGTLRRVARVLGWGAGLAVFTELAQAMPAVGRDPDALDVLADLTGLLLGWGADSALSARRQTPSPVNEQRPADGGV